MVGRNSGGGRQETPTVVDLNSNGGRQELRWWSARTPAVVGRKLQRWSAGTPTVVDRKSNGGRQELRWWSAGNSGGGRQEHQRWSAGTPVVVGGKSSQIPPFLSFFSFFLLPLHEMSGAIYNFLRVAWLDVVLIFPTKCKVEWIDYTLVLSSPGMQVIQLLKVELGAQELMGRASKSRPPLFDAWDFQDNTCLTYLTDFCRHVQLALE
ncbi:hypothetical protein IEQ34_013550 [Dendrobium chrysotoxum]|uniref:Uncharacterized protein n=1 Tax=Dendrobium chrysotoxum TaxID=161865 RepID=A0AAV7G962_DENCH|nr:hypothetical protein IEQ34_013550 [Dendrobium chrysotoxum]